MINDPIQRLRALAREAKNYQIERGWTDTQLCREIGHLGSTKTFTRILDDADTLDELNIDKQLNSYEAALEHITARREKDKLAEPEYDDFGNVVNSRAAVLRAITEDSIARFVVIEGENGCGKDAVKNALLKKHQKTAIAVEANEFWRESLGVPIRAIIDKLSLVRMADEESGQPFQLPRYPAEQQEELFKELRKRKRILIINEGHHMGPRGLNLIKSIINQTPTVVIFLCIPALLRRLMTGAYDEAVQLFGNRLCERVYLPSPPKDEILLMFERRGVKWSDRETESLAAKVVEHEAPSFGNWRIVGQITRELVTLTKKNTRVTQAQFETAFTLVKSRRVQRQKERGVL